MNYKSEEHVSCILALFLTANWEEISYIFAEILNFSKVISESWGLIVSRPNQAD